MNGREGYNDIWTVVYYICIEKKWKVGKTGFISPISGTEFTFRGACDVLNIKVEGMDV